MPYHGPRLDPVPETDTIWTWFFERTDGSSVPKVSRARNGFRDAATNKHTSFQEVKTQAVHCSSALAAVHNLQPLQTVAVIAQNSVNYVVATFAAGRLGAIVSALASQALSQDIAHYLEASSARIVFYDRSTQQEVAKSWKGPGAPPYTLISLDAEAGAGTRSLDQLIADVTGLVHLLHLPILLDQEVVVMGEFTLASMLDTIIKHQCVELWLVPPLLIRMVSDEVLGKYDLSFVRQFNTGAAPLAPQIIEQLAIAYPGVALRQAWGMTESCSCLTVTPPGLQTYKHAAKVGKPVPGTELKIISVETGKEANFGEEGELWARGPQVTMGYLNNEEETRKSFDADGFLHTGDLGIIHPDGFVTIHDRIKEMIKVRGHGVAPAELEDALHSHPKVADVAVIGVPHDYSGEVPRAYVVLKSSASPSKETAKELALHVEKLKARYMRIAGGIEFLDAIPKSAAGKILRKVLKEDYKQKVGKGVLARL
ncbi:hypothetical protein SCUCBS95973_008982 [Sporothrix curviconia]|uniref:Uncharacterized protein n=1 Tax=Sporothrix curviconia TaxID=1260050 RepID=A0ABP0CUD2_9PEZI